MISGTGKQDALPLAREDIFFIDYGNEKVLYGPKLLKVHALNLTAYTVWLRWDGATALTGPEIQMFISTMAYSPPVRPSIAASDEFQKAFPKDTIQRVLSETVPRLVFRKGGPGREEAEKVLEAAFNRCVEEPDNFLPLMSEAVNEANALITGTRR